MACDRRLFNKRINRRGDHVLFPPFHDILVTFSLRFFFPSPFPSPPTSLVAAARLNGLPLFCLHFIRPCCSTGAHEANSIRTISPCNSFVKRIRFYTAYSKRSTIGYSHGKKMFFRVVMSLISLWKRSHRRLNIFMETFASLLKL